MIKKLGRPCIGHRPLTSLERKNKSIAKKRLRLKNAGLIEIKLEVNKELHFKLLNASDIPTVEKKEQLVVAVDIATRMILNGCEEVVEND